MSVQSQENVGGHVEGKYLTFMLSGERYGIEILRVQEIIGVLPTTRVPGNPEYIKGVINLRGKIIPVADLRLKFGLPEIPYNERTCIIVVDIEIAGSRLLAGVVVDTVLEVVSLPSDLIEPAPDYGQHLNTDSVLGLGRAPDQTVVILLDINSTLQDKHLTTKLN